MYAVVSCYQFRTPPSKALVEKIEKEGIDPITRLPGFRAYFAARTSDTEVFSAYSWDSQADAERGIEQQANWASEFFASELIGAERLVGEVVEARRREGAGSSSEGAAASYARLSRFRFRHPLDADAREQVSRVVDELAAAPGFRVYGGFFPSATEAVTVHTWDSKADSERGLEATRSSLQRAIGQNLAEPPRRVGGEVIIHRLSGRLK